MSALILPAEWHSRQLRCRMRIISLLNRTFVVIGSCEDPIRGKVRGAIRNARSAVRSAGRRSRLREFTFASTGGGYGTAEQDGVQPICAGCTCNPVRYFIAVVDFEP